MSKREKGHVGQRGGKWFVKVELPRDAATGKRRIHWSTHDTEREAQATLTRVLDAVKAGAHVARERMTLDEWLNTWLDTYAVLEVTPASLDQYRRCLLHVRRHYGGIRLQQLEADQLQDLWANLVAGYEHEGRKIQLDRRTVSNVRLVLGRALKHAVRLRKLVRNPVADTSLPKRDPAADLRNEVAEESAKAFSEAEVGKLLHGLRGTELYVPVALAAGTGMRIGEVCGLRWGDLSLDPRTSTGQVNVRAAIELRDKAPIRLKTPKTTSSRRTIPIAGDLVRTLAEHRARAAERGLACGLQLSEGWFVFPASPAAPETPSNPRLLGMKFKRVAIKAGVVDVHFHRLRHFHATALLERGERVEVVAARLGHSDVMTTVRVYASVLESAKDKAAATAGAVLDKALKYAPPPSGPVALKVVK
jgi:integrase